MTDGLSSDRPILITVEARAHGWRVDHYLSRIFPNFSRVLFQKAIDQQSVLVNGIPVKTSRRLRINDRISVRLPELPDRTLPPEDIPLDILHEDDAIVVLNKPPGLIVHPGKGNYRGTLAGALQFHFDRLSDVAGQLRPGIVHRLDRGHERDSGHRQRQPGSPSAQRPVRTARGQEGIFRAGPRASSISTRTKSQPTSASIRRNARK